MVRTQVLWYQSGKVIEKFNKFGLEINRVISFGIIDAFGYITRNKTKTILVDSDGDISKMVGY